MTFNYDLTTPTDITRVRFHVGDTDPDAAIFSDEEITFVIAESGGEWRRAVIACLKSIIGRISAAPDFTADWLKVDYGRSLAGYRALLAQKEKEFGLAGRIGGRAAHTYRPDSLQKGPPDWNNN